MRNGVIYTTLCLCLLAVPGLSHIKSTPEEYELKAAFLYNFAKFITWPDSSFSNSDDFFYYCSTRSKQDHRILTAPSNKNRAG